MISPRRDPSSNRLFQRGGSVRQHRPNHHRGGRPAADGVPALTKCNSGSTGSSESPLQSSKRASCLYHNHHYQQQSLTRNDSNASKNHHHHTSNDSHILKGAAILRNQLSDVGTNGSTSSSSSSGRIQQSVAHSDRDDWDPFRIPATSSLLSQENRQEDVPTMGDALSQHSAKLIRDKGDHLQESNDDDTVKMLDRAKALYQSMTFAGTGVQHQTTHNKKPYVQTKNNKENKGNYLVERVTDMDNSTFSSGGAGGTYLPKHLLSGSSPLPSNKSNYTQMSPTDASAVLAKPVANSRSKDLIQLLDTQEAIETTTLDFLANLHVNDDEDVSAFFLDDGKSSDAGETNHVESRGTFPSCQNSAISSLSSSRHGKLPRITQAAAPFQNMIAPCSYIYDELLRDPAYQHAVRAGALWQSLCSQHVRFPSLWWDGKEPGAPPLGTPEKNLWTYLGRHRVKADRKLNSLIGNRGSSGRLLLHLVVRDIVTLQPIEDICCGCFHPNARGVRTTRMFDPRIEDCRDVWIGHRRRGKAKSSSSTIESVLRHQNKGRADKSPLGGEVARKSKQGGIDNGNLKAVFGEKPPVSTVMVTESDLFELFQTQLDGSNPASIVLLRRFLRQRIG
jgi:hypothetical protein